VVGSEDGTVVALGAAQVGGWTAGSRLREQEGPKTP